MTISEGLLPEFEQEMANTRKTLERIPNDKFDWQPHAKSMTVQGLVTHMSNMPGWTVMTMKQDSFDMAPKGEEPVRETPANSIEDALAMFDKKVAEARTAIVEASDERWHGVWSLLAGGESVFSMPRIAVVRSMIMNHMIHHRAQLSVYLRLNDVPVPSLYGPTADDAQ